LVTTPIEQFKSQFLVNLFPIANRIDVLATRDDIKNQLSLYVLKMNYDYCIVFLKPILFCREGKNGWTFTDLIADLQFLLYLTEYLSVNDDIPILCNTILNRDVPINEGYKILLRSIAGIE